MPRNIEFVVAQTYCWFSNSTHRQLRYKEIFETINIGEEPLKILKLSDTRWLSIAGCVERILQQYDELKLHFNLMKDQERCHQAGLLYEEYRKYTTRLYLVFLRPILQDLNRVNKLFQLDRASPVKLLEDLVALFKCLRKKVMQPATFPTWKAVTEYDLDEPRNLLPTSAVCLGVEFNLEADKLLPGRENAAVLHDVKERCKEFVIELLKEMEKRLPTNMELLESLSQLSPDVMLSNMKPPFEQMSFVKLCSGNVATIERQWDRVNEIEWMKRYKGTDVEEFWVDVLRFTDAAGERPFRDLALFVLSLLALPFSNASVERCFSQMNLIKSKLRNRMGEEMLASILHIRGFISRREICCNKFKATPAMLSRFTNSIYDNIAQDALPDDF